jgi:hypothetical protein
VEKKKKSTNTVGGGSSHFSMEETIAFLNTMEEILPFGDPEWQIVVNLHNNNHGSARSKESLQRKFNKLRNAKIPTGDPHCPADVWLAKKVAQLMVQSRTLWIWKRKLLSIKQETTIYRRPTSVLTTVGNQSIMTRRFATSHQLQKLINATIHVGVPQVSPSPTA